MVKSIIKFSIPSILNLVFSAVAVMVLTRVFNEDEYGVISIYNTNVTTLVAMMCLGLDSSFIRFYNEPPSGDDSAKLGGKLLILALVFTLIMGGGSFLFYGDQLSEELFGIKERLIWGAVTVCTIGQVILRFLGIVYRMEFKAAQYGAQRVLLSFLNKFSFLVVLLGVTDIVDILGANSICIMILAFVYCILQRKSIKIPGATQAYKGYGPIFKYALFSAPILVCINMNNSVTQQIISKNISISAVGVYSSAFFFSSLISALQNGFSSFWGGYMYANYKNEQKQIQKVNEVVLFFLILVIAGLVLGRDVIYLLLGEKYQTSKGFYSLLILNTVLLFATETTAYGINLVNKVYISLIGYIIYALLNCFLCNMFSIHLGVQGAAFAAAISGTFIYLYLTCWGQKFYRSVRSMRKNIIEALLMIMIGVCGTVLDGMLRIAVVLLMVALAILYNKEIIVTVVGVVKKHLYEFSNSGKE